jgi:hypothetical protein
MQLSENTHGSVIMLDILLTWCLGPNLFLSCREDITYSTKTHVTGGLQYCLVYKFPVSRSIMLKPLQSLFPLIFSYLPSWKPHCLLAFFLPRLILPFPSLLPVYKKSVLVPSVYRKCIKAEPSITPNSYRPHHQSPFDRTSTFCTTS